MSTEQQTDQSNNEQPSVGFYVFFGVIIIALVLMAAYLIRSYF